MNRPQSLILNGAGDEGRTRTVRIPRDFKSLASASSATPAAANPPFFVAFSAHISPNMEITVNFARIPRANRQ